MLPRSTRKLKYIHKNSLRLLLLIFICLPPKLVAADIGPKPTMSFNFVWEADKQLSIVEGILLQCADAECADSYALEELGPQHFTCTDLACDSMAYGYTQYAKLVITFSDGVTRESQVFGKNYDESVYEVTVKSTDLTVIEKKGSRLPIPFLDPFNFFTRAIGVIFGLLMLTILGGISAFLIVKTKDKPLICREIALPCLGIWIIALPTIVVGTIFAPTVPLTIVVEGVVISIYALLKKYPLLPWVTIVTLGNLVTQTLFLIILSVVSTWGMSVLLTIFLEIVIWLLEASLIHLTLRRKTPIFTSLGISLMINVVSMGIGLLLPV